MPTRHHVLGTITYNGRPVESATVTFWRIPLAVNDWKTVKPMAIVAPDGSFEPNSYDEKDGAVAGEYAVTMIWRPSRAAPDLLKGKYADPGNPLTTVVVKEGENQLPPIELTGPEVSIPAVAPPSGI